MLKVKPLSSVEYLTDSTSDTGGAINYYTDANAEPAGQIWCPGNWILQDGEVADTLTIKLMAQGRHPLTGQLIVTGKGSQRRAGYDLTFSAPKSWSALWTVCDGTKRQKLDKMLLVAVREAMNQVLERGLLEARLGKGGRRREALTGLVAALYRHRTSREGDPQAHIHVALMNLGRRKDGSIRAINSERLCEAHKTIGALFRLVLSERLELCGVPVKADLEHGFIIEGQPPELLDIWSKRRKQISKVAYEQGLERTAGRMQAVDVIALKTRRKKWTLPDFNTLNKLWQVDAMRVGWVPNAEWSRIDRQPIQRTEDESKANATSIIRRAIENLSEVNSVFNSNELEAEALTLAVGQCTTKAVRHAIDLALKHEALISFEHDGLMTTQLTLQHEQEIIEAAKLRHNDKKVGFSETAIALALSNAEVYNEQNASIRHALSGVGLAIVKNTASARKAPISLALKIACMQDKRQLLHVVPSLATAVAPGKESSYRKPYVTLDKLLSELRNARYWLGEDHVILLDNAHACRTNQMHELLGHINNAGAKLVLQGDVDAASSFRRGSPLSLISKALGNQKFGAILHQRHTWQREASIHAKDGKIAEAMVAYAKQGDVITGNSREAILKAIDKAFKEERGNTVAIAATIQIVDTLNQILRKAAWEIGLLHGPELTVIAIQRERRKDLNLYSLKVAAGDTLLLGADAKIFNLKLHNGSRLTVKEVDAEKETILFSLESGQEFSCTTEQFSLSGKDGNLIVVQHAYAMTPYAAQGMTWNKTLWLTSNEDRRSAFVAMTRHRDALTMFIDKSTLPSKKDIMTNISRTNVKVRDSGDADLSDIEIVKIIGKSMERVKRPRNAIDLLAIPELTAQNSFGNFNLEPITSISDTHQKAESNAPVSEEPPSSLLPERPSRETYPPEEVVVMNDKTNEDVQDFIPNNMFMNFS